MICTLSVVLVALSNSNGQKGSKVYMKLAVLNGVICLAVKKERHCSEPLLAFSWTEAFIVARLMVGLSTTCGTFQRR